MAYTKLYRSTDNKVIAGVCGGLGEYFEIDPNLARVFAVLLFFATQGFALLAYVVGWVIIPKRPITGEVVEKPPERRHSSWTRYLPGLILIFLGSILLIREHWYWIDFDEWWPALLIAVGLLLLFRRRNHTKEAEAEAEAEAHRESEAHNGGTTP